MNWSLAAQRAMRRHVYRAVERLDPVRYSQEPAYVAALLARLDGIVYSSHDSRIEIRSTIVADRGPNSAESKWGADFAIVGVFHGPEEKIEKGVLAQAKRGSLRELNSNAEAGFFDQCARMARATDAVLGLEVPAHAGEQVLVREIYVQPVTRAVSLDDRPWHPPMTIGIARNLASYLSDRFLLCQHGDRGADVVRRFGDSRLSQITMLCESAV